jgi:hypothetical protein
VRIGVLVMVAPTGRRRLAADGDLPRADIVGGADALGVDGHHKAVVAPIGAVAAQLTAR